MPKITLTHWKEFLNREVDRKEFLMYIGLFIVSILGISRLIQAFNNPEIISKKEPTQTKGFGSRSYGV